MSSPDYFQKTPEEVSLMRAEMAELLAISQAITVAVEQRLGDELSIRRRQNALLISALDLSTRNLKQYEVALAFAQARIERLQAENSELTRRAMACSTSAEDRSLRLEERNQAVMGIVAGPVLAIPWPLRRDRDETFWRNVRGELAISHSHTILKNPDPSYERPSARPAETILDGLFIKWTSLRDGFASYASLLDGGVSFTD